MAYGDYVQTPSLGQQVTYVVSQEESLRYHLDSFAAVFPAIIFFVHTPLCVDLNVTIGGVAFKVSKVSFGNSQRNWYDGQTFGGVLPAGSPF
jgi:hypothetical protein